MRLEEAIAHLREGKEIYRISRQEDGSLKGSPELPLCSFYLTLWDVLAEDWSIKGVENEITKI